MSKLTGPCLSLSASGKLAKSIVYAAWKGIAYARQYVTPANPNTAGQQTQRGYLTSALALWHDVTYVLLALDLANLNRGASILGRIMSGFNMYVKNYINSKVAGATPIQIYGTVETSVAAPNTEIDCSSKESTVNVGLRYGYSPSSMPYSITRDEGAVAGTTHTFYMPAVTTGQVVYYQIYDKTASSEVNLGIGKIAIT